VRRNVYPYRDHRAATATTTATAGAAEREN
jgi:hypothetical protein